MDDLVERLEAALGETSPLSSCYLKEEAATEIRSLRAQVAQERAGIVSFLRAVATAGDDETVTEIFLNIADAIEAQKDKEPRA
jgi:hypothetical protein